MINRASFEIHIPSGWFLQEPSGFKKIENLWSFYISSTLRVRVHFPRDPFGPTIPSIDCKRRRLFRANDFQIKITFTSARVTRWNESSRRFHDGMGRRSVRQWAIVYRHWQFFFFLSFRFAPPVTNAVLREKKRERERERERKIERWDHCSRIFSELMAHASVDK